MRVMFQNYKQFKRDTHILHDLLFILHRPLLCLYPPAVEHAYAHAIVVIVPVLLATLLGRAD